MKVLVLGATGFIGGNITRAALTVGWVVRGFRRNPDSVGDLEGMEIEWIEGDLTRPDSLRSAMQGCEIVFHAAAYYPHSKDPKPVDEHVTLSLTEIMNVIDVFKASGAKRLIYTSTLSTIGHPPPGKQRLADERDYYISGSLPQSGYYECKIAMEKQVENAAQQGVDAVILNPTAVFGPGDVHLSLGSMLIALAKGQAFFWLPGNVNVVDVRDAAEAHIQAALNGHTGERYIIGGHNYTMRKTLDIAASVVDVRKPWLKLPLPVIDLLVLASDIAPNLPLPVNHMRAVRLWQGYNTDKAKSELHLSPRPFELTVHDAIDWFKRSGYLK